MQEFDVFKLLQLCPLRVQKHRGQLHRLHSLQTQRRPGLQQSQVPLQANEHGQSLQGSLPKRVSFYHASPSSRSRKARRSRHQKGIPRLFLFRSQNLWSQRLIVRYLFFIKI